MSNESTPPPVFTGAELALADMLAAVIDELIASDAMTRDGFERTAAALRDRYEGKRLRSSVAMVEYLRRQVARPQGCDDLVRLQPFDYESVKGSN
jgi:hypothetical protein